jgi:uncharacterized protein YqfA (UPF0365 family)
MAQARAEVRRAEAIARRQEMKAKVTERRAELVLAEAEIPAATAMAFRAGRLHVRRPSNHRAGRFKEDTRPASRIVGATLAREVSGNRLSIESWENEGGARN